MTADIEYHRAADWSVKSVTLYLRGDTTEVIRNLPNKAAAVAICRERGADLLSKA